VTDYNKQQKLHGHTDIPLSQEGLDQAERVGKRMASWERFSATDFDLIYSSDLSRAKQV